MIHSLYAHAHENVVKTKAGDYVQAFRLPGELSKRGRCADINNWHDAVETSCRNIAERSGLAVDPHRASPRERLPER